MRAAFYCRIGGQGYGFLLPEEADKLREFFAEHQDMVYCLQNKCHSISTVCLQLRESVGYRYRRCVLCSYLEEALTHTVTHTTK